MILDPRGLSLLSYDMNGMIDLLDLYDMIHNNSSAFISLVDISDMFASMMSKTHIISTFQHLNPGIPLYRGTYLTQAINCSQARARESIDGVMVQSERRTQNLIFLHVC